MITKLYGSDIRAVRVFNLAIHVIWGYLIIAHLAGIAIIDLPNNIEPDFTIILGLSFSIAITTAFTFIDHSFRLKLKYISLTLGSLTQTLIALKYVTNYPPFDIMVIVCSLLALWFLGGAIFIKNTQGKENVVGEFK